MKVSEVMTEGTVTDALEDTLAQAASKMWEEQTGSLLIIDAEGGLGGIVTERDILKAVANGLDPATTTVKEVIGSDPITIHPGATLREAAKAMTEHWIRHLPVLDNGKLVGMISQRDLAGVLAGALSEPETLHQLFQSSELAREKRLKRIEAGTWD